MQAFAGTALTYGQLEDILLLTAYYWRRRHENKPLRLTALVYFRELSECAPTKQILLSILLHLYG